jgi:endonuclease/exonuclease/phosphatase family metal-dependent hydrolase
MSSKPAAAAAAAAADSDEVGGKRKHDFGDSDSEGKEKRAKVKEVDKYPKVRAVNWNVLASEYTRYNLDGKTNETVAQRNARWVHQVKFLLEHADIATLQEVTVDWIAYAMAGIVKATDDATEEFKANAGLLGKAFEYHFVKREYLEGAVLKPGQKSKNDGCAVLLRRDLFAPFQDGKFVSARGGGNFSDKASLSKLDPRCCAIVHVRTLDGKEVATVASVHLEGKPERSDIRTKQLEETRDMILKVAGTSKPRLMIVAGDFNQEYIYRQIKDTFGEHMLCMYVHVTNLSQDRPSWIPSCIGVPDFEFMAAKLDPPKAKGFGAIEPADEYTSVYGAIDQVLMMSSTERLQILDLNLDIATKVEKLLTSQYAVVLPEPKDRVKTPDGKPATGRGGTKPSPYLCPPYEDGGKWSSDHWAMLYKILLP